MPPPLAPADALLARMAGAATPDAAIAAFEGAFHTLPAFASAALFGQAARLYEQCRRREPAWLLAALAAQMQGGAPRAALPADAEAVLAHPLPGTGLLRTLEQLDREQAPARAAALFEAVLPHMPPLEEYWVHYRMSLVYAALGRPELAFLLACVAVQIEPLAPQSLLPARAVAAWLARIEAWRDAAALLARWEAANPGQTLLDAPPPALLAARAGHQPAATGRRDRALVAESARPALALTRCGRGVPYALESLLQAETRPAITLAELDDAELLIAGGSIAVWSADGTPQPDLSVGGQPSLVRRRIDERRQRGEAVDERALDRVVLIGDAFPAPSLCHFMLDQATRLALYARAGIDLADCVVVGPDLAEPYQREIARRLGARRYLGTAAGAAGFGRVRARRLAVVSNCHDLRHSAHLGADWALDAVRRGFADITGGALPKRRLLVSRADAAGRRLLNEDAALALLRPFGFERIVPGELALADQARAFAAATHVVAPHGAALANLAFCAPGTRVLEIFHPHYGTYSYAVLAPTLRLDYAAMIGFDGTSDAAQDNDPALANTRSDRSLARDVRADLAHLAAWARADTPA